MAGILRQCSQEVRLVVARSVREGPPTTTTSGTSNSPSLSKRSSLTSENLSRTRHPSSSMMVETDGMINNLPKKIFLRTERLLESNHNLEKILDHLLEQVRCLSRVFRERRGRTTSIILISELIKVFASNIFFFFVVFVFGRHFHFDSARIQIDR